MKVLTIVVLLISSAQSLANEIEVFKRVATDPQNLLIKNYEEARVLAIGQPNHKRRVAFELLVQLLEQVGGDENLRYIVFEGPHDESFILEKLSETPLEEVVASSSPPLGRDAFFCQAPEWAYIVSEILPRIRKWNKKRSTPLTAKFIDMSWKSPTVEEWEEREQFIADRFHEDIWLNLEDKSKAIVFYHVEHLLKGIGSDGESSWLNRALEASPEVQTHTKTVLIEDGYSSVRFAFAQRQAERASGRAWAIDFDPLRGILPETGMDVFREGHELSSPIFGESRVAGDFELSDLGDGLVYSEARYEDRYQTAMEYMGDICRP